MSTFYGFIRALSSLRNLNKIKLALLCLFSLLLIFQYAIGFNAFEDYLIIFVFVLFINDLHFKTTVLQININHQERTSRLIMSVVFFVLFLMPFIFDFANFSNEIRFTIYKLGFILWAQIFLLDSYLHYKKTNSKKWLVFANTAMLMILFGAFIS